MSKKKKEPNLAAEVKEEIDVSAAENEGAETAKAEPVVATETAESYTLTAEEFEAARAHIASLQKDKDDLVGLLQRNQADFDNFRRRNQTARADSYEDGRRDVVKALLPILDNFDRVSENAAADGDEWAKGVLLVQRQLLDEMKKMGLSEIEAEGKFDPSIHEAVMREKVEGKESDEILCVLQKGYRFGEKIIRHSMVKVAE